MSNSQVVGSQAVVIGASIAGLLTARVLRDYFDQVTIVERDQLPEEPTFRKGIPQAHHTHVLMMRGQQSLERFFPGFEGDLDAAGVPRMRWLTDTQMFYGDGWLPQFDLG